MRGNLPDRARMRLLPPELEGPDNDLSGLIDHWLERAVADPAAGPAPGGRMRLPQRV